MRIRKRAVPLPFSLLSPVTPPAFSDPHRYLPVQLSQPSDLPSPPSQLEDLRPPIFHDHRPTAPTPLRSDGQLVIQTFEDEKTNQEQRDSNSSKQSDPGAVADDNGVKLQIPLPLPNQTTVTATEGRWCDGDKAIPLKKRKVSLEMNGVVVAMTGEYRKMKSMTNKKCPLNNTPIKCAKKDHHDDDYEEDDSNSDSDTKKTRRRRKRKNKGGSRVIMQGSRCSRVNGRGWRCMQPTLVGYSLCEHHLGKGGRLRSINSATLKLDKSNSNSNSIHHDDGGGGDVEEEERKPISTVAGNGRKRMRVGMVKARSLSSLLCQPNTAFKSN